MANLNYWDGTQWVAIGTGGPQGPAGPVGGSGPDGESVTVFETDTVPTAFRTGDIWLEPTTVLAGSRDGLTLAEVEAVVDGKLSKLPAGGPGGLNAAEVVDLVDAAIAKLPQPEPPTPDLGWMPLAGFTSFGVSVNGFARELNGVVYLRGTYLSQFSFIPASQVASLPAGIPRPAFEYTVLVYGTADGSTTALPGKLTIKTDGAIFMDVPNSNTVVFDGVTIPVK